MRVHAARDVLRARAELDRDRGLGDEIGGARPEDVDAEDAVGLRVRDDLDAAVGLSEAARAPVRHERERADRDVDAALRGVLLREPDARELGRGVDDARDRVVVHVPGDSGHELDGGDALLLRLVREHRAGDRVADREDARDGRLVALVHLDASALVETDADLGGAEPGEVRPAPDRDEDDVGVLLGPLALALEGHAHAVLRPLGVGRRRLALERDALALERTAELRRHAAVHGRDDLVHELDDRHASTEPAPHRSELEPDGAAADHEEALRDARQRQRLGRADDALAVEREAAEGRRLAAGRDQDARRLERAVADRDAPGGGDPPRPAHPLDLVLLEEAGDALREAAHDAVLPGHHRRQVELDAAHLHTVRGERAPHLPVVLARVEERLRRDAADVEARPAERRVLLDARDPHAELRGADRGDVAAGPGADDDEVETVGHQTSRRSRTGFSSRSFTCTREVTACSPSTRRWSSESATYIIGRTTIWSPTTTGRFSILCMPRMPLCGGFRIGVERSEP